MRLPNNRKVQDVQSTTTLEKIEKLHPHKMLLYLSIFGSSLIFLFMLIAFTSSHTPPGPEEAAFSMPKAFIFSSLVLVFSSYFVSRFISSFQDEKMKKLRNLLGITIVLGFIFTISQYWGWHQLDKSGFGLTGMNSGAYLYVISGLHILHLVVGIFFMTYQFIRVSRVANDPVQRLIMVTNPYQKMKIEMLATFWHFIDILWVGLFLYFLFVFG